MNYKAVVIQVIHYSKNTASVIKSSIVDMLPGHIVEIKPELWSVGSDHRIAEEIAQQQLEDRYPGSTVAVIGKRADGLTTKCKFIIDPDASNNGRVLLYLCSSNSDDGFIPAFNDDIYYINLYYEIDPYTMECNFGPTVAKEIIEKTRKISKAFDAGENNRFNCTNYVLNPLLKNSRIVRRLYGRPRYLPDDDPYFVKQVMFDAINGFTRSAEVIRQLMFQKYD